MGEICRKVFVKKYKKYLTPVLVVIFFLVGLVVILFSIKQIQTVKNKAAVSNGIGRISLVPVSATHYIGDLFPVSIKFNTGGASISSIAMRLVYRFTGNPPELNVTDSGGSGSNQIFPNSALISTGDWTFPIRSVTRAGGNVTIDFSAINTSTAGFSSTSDVDLGTIYFKVNRAIASNPLALTFDTTRTKMITKSNSTDILRFPVDGSFTILSSIASPTASPIPTPTATPVTVPSPTPLPTPTSTPAPEVLNLNVSLQGVNSNTGDTRPFTVTIQNGQNVISQYVVNLTQGSNGSYSGSISDLGITPGNYTIFIKDGSHLRKNISAGGANGQGLFSGTNFATGTLKAADFNNDNTLNILDLAAWLSVYTSISVPVTPSNKLYDLNGDAKIDISDIALMLTNYTQLENHGD